VLCDFFEIGHQVNLGKRLFLAKTSRRHTEKFRRGRALLAVR
jgi:hypothetical protein